MQARMKSVRLPGKVLGQIREKPMIQYLLENLYNCRQLDDNCITTSIEPTDYGLFAWCKARGIPCIRGPLEDVAGRVEQAVHERSLDGFVRISGDSPLLDWRLVDYCVSLFRKGAWDIVTNVMKRTFPMGQSVEVIDTEVFFNAYRKMEDPDDLEHVTRYFYRHQKAYNIRNVESGGLYGDIQLSIDTPVDMARFERILARMDRPHWQYNWREILGLLSLDDA